MKVAVIGNGNMAKGIGSRILAGGHELLILGRNASKANALAEELNKIKKTEHPARGVALQASEIKSDIVVLAVHYSAAKEIIDAIRPSLAGKVLIDITNPLNQTYDGLITLNTSAAEEISKLAGNKVSVVKAFNTIFSSTLLSDVSLDVFIAGDDQKAKSLVAELIKDGGMHPLDIGALKLSRQLEQFALFSIMIQQPLGLGFNSSWKLATSGK